MLTVPEDPWWEHIEDDPDPELPNWVEREFCIDGSEGQDKEKKKERPKKKETVYVYDESKRATFDCCECGKKNHYYYPSS